MRGIVRPEFRSDVYMIVEKRSWLAVEDTKLRRAMWYGTGMHEEPIFYCGDEELYVPPCGFNPETGEFYILWNYNLYSHRDCFDGIHNLECTILPLLLQESPLEEYTWTEDDYEHYDIDKAEDSAKCKFGKNPPDFPENCYLPDKKSKRPCSDELYGLYQNDFHKFLLGLAGVHANQYGQIEERVPYEGQ